MKQKRLQNKKKNKKIKLNIFCISKTKTKLKLLVTKITHKKIKAKTISYEIVWATERKPPNKAYLELEDHPEKIMP